MRILVVDDAIAVRARLVQLLLEQPGVDEIEETGDADDAIARLRASRFDVVVLDVHLPGRNGLTVLEACNTSLPPVCFIVLTNDASEHYRRAALSRGAHYFLDKSSEFERVVAIVRARQSNA